MFSEKQLKELGIKISQEQINALAVRKIKAPSSSTLTEEEYNQIIKGTFIEGSFLGYENPVLFPAGFFGTDDRYATGIFIGGGYSSKIQSYLIDSTTNIIELTTNNYISLIGLSNVNGKNIPAYPSPLGTFTLKCVDGTLTWVEDI